MENMMTRPSRLAFGLVAAVFATIGLSSAALADQWPQWRGPLGTGASPDGSPPVTWSETENIRWKVKIPGRGSATPIVWGDKIFIQTAVSTGKKPDAPAGDASKDAAVAKTNDAKREADAPKREDVKRDEVKRDEGKRDEARTEGAQRRGGPDGVGQRGGPGGRGPGGFGQRGGRGGGMRSVKPTEIQQFVLLCLDRKTGKPIWEKVAREELPHEGHHGDHGFASHSPATDGQHVIAYFGSRGLHCYDMNGNLQWSKDLGRMRTKNEFGEGSSPALFGNTIVVNWDHEGEDFIAAFDKRSGQELWREPRDEDTTWGTPLIVEHNGQAQVVTGASNRIRSYNLATGKQIWETGGLTPNAIPSPVAAGDMVYLTSGFRGSALKAIRLGAMGDISNGDAIVWTLSKATPYVPSPLLYDNRLYFFSGNNAVLSCYDAKTGEPMTSEPKRIEGLQNVYASPVAAAGRVYLVGRNGTTAVIKHATQPTEDFEMLATNKLDEGIDASPAIAGDAILLRGQESLYCIAEK
jgi:outer membrane protein assembly factor BamB